MRNRSEGGFWSSRPPSPHDSVVALIDGEKQSYSGNNRNADYKSGLYSSGESQKPFPISSDQTAGKGRTDEEEKLILERRRLAIQEGSEVLPDGTNAPNLAKALVKHILKHLTISRDQTSWSPSKEKFTALSKSALDSSIASILAVVSRIPDCDSTY